MTEFIQIKIQDVLKNIQKDFSITACYLENSKENQVLDAIGIKKDQIKSSKLNSSSHIIISKHGEYIANLTLLSDKKISLNEKNKNLLKTYIDQICLILELKEVNKSLNDKQEQLEITKNKKDNVFNNMNEGIVVQAHDGKIIEFNPSALNILGLTENQLLGRDSMDPRWRSIKSDGSPFPGEQHPAMLALKTKKSVKNALMGVHSPSGKLKWIRINSNPIITETSLSVVTTFQDITDDIHKSSELQAYAKGLDSYAIISKTDVKGTITFVNENFCKNSGYTKKQVLGHSHQLIKSDYHSKDFFKNLWNTITKGKVWRGEIKNKRKDGTYYWVDTTITPILDLSGKIKEFISFRYDITDRKNAQELLIKNEKKLKTISDQAIDANMTLAPPTWNFTDCNPATLKLFKVKSIEEFKKLGPWNVSPEKQADGQLSAVKAKKMIEMAMNKGSHYFEWLHSTINGEIIPCTVLLSRIEEDESIYLHAVVRDISKQKELESEIFDTQQYLDLALEGAGLGIWDWDLTTGDVKFDRRWAQMLGLDINEIKMHLSTWQDRVHPDDLASCYEDIENYMNGKTSYYENTHRMKHVDGSWVYILDRGRFSAWDNEGKPTRFTGTHLDVTQSKIAEEQRLKELNEILSSTPSCLIVIDKTGRILQVNKQGLNIFGYDKQEQIIGKSLYDFIDQEDLEQVKDFNKKICNGNHQNLKFKLSVKGELKWIESYSAPYKLANGYLGHIGIFNDISERVKAEEDYNYQKAIALHQAKLASIGELAAGVGHEINNPLAIMKGYIGAMERKSDQGKLSVEDFKNYVHKLDIAADRINNIVKGLRNFSRTDSLEDENFDPIVAITESYKLIHEIYKSDGVTVITDLDFEKDQYFIKGSLGKFQQIIMNLLSNAKDALTDSEFKNITISASTYKDIIQVEVCDSGHGIPKLIQDKIFDPFFTTKEVNKGTGIGLSLVHKFIKEMNGNISIDSKLNQGTTFIIELPVAK